MNNGNFTEMDNRMVYLPRKQFENYKNKIERLKTELKTICELHNELIDEFKRREAELGKSRGGFAYEVAENLSLVEQNQKLRKAIEEIETELQKLVELLEEDGERDYIDFIQNIEEIAQKTLEE